jgi:hypothetical protein
MTRSILVCLAVLTLSTSAALAAHRTHHHHAMNAYAAVPATPSPAMWTGGVSSSDHDMYIRNLRDSGYSPKNNFNASGNVGNAIASGLIIRLWERPVREPAEACVHRKSHPS